MRLSDDLTVRGFLADADTGAGLGGLRVELWSGNGSGPTLVGTGRSDDDGAFRLSLSPGRVTEVYHGGDSVDVEWRVLDGDELVLSEPRALSVEDSPQESIELSVPSVLPERE